MKTIKNKIILLVFLGVTGCCLVAGDKDSMGKDGIFEPTAGYSAAVKAAAMLGVGGSIDEAGLKIAAAAIATQAAPIPQAAATGAAKTASCDYDGDDSSGWDSDSDGLKKSFPASKPLPARLARSYCLVPGAGRGAPGTVLGDMSALQAFAEPAKPADSDLL